MQVQAFQPCGTHDRLWLIIFPLQLTDGLLEFAVEPTGIFNLSAWPLLAAFIEPVDTHHVLAMAHVLDKIRLLRGSRSSACVSVLRIARVFGKAVLRPCVWTRPVIHNVCFSRPSWRHWEGGFSQAGEFVHVGMGIGVWW